MRSALGQDGFIMFQELDSLFKPEIPALQEQSAVCALRPQPVFDAVVCGPTQQDGITFVWTFRPSCATRHVFKAFRRQASF